MAKKKTVRRMKKPTQVPLECYFCKEKKGPTFEDTSVLTRYITDRGKITSRSRNGLCSKHQSVLSDNIKYARHLALLPFLIRE